MRFPWCDAQKTQTSRRGSCNSAPLLCRKGFSAMKKSIMTAVFLLSASVSHALAADLSAPTYTKAPVLAAPSYNWSGFYAGLHGGYGWGRSPTTVTPDPTDANFIVDPTGFTY